MKFTAALISIVSYLAVARGTLRGARQLSEEDSVNLGWFANETTFTTFINGPLLTEPWVEPNSRKTFKSSPQKGFTEDLAIAGGAKEVTVIFDMVDRVDMKGVATTFFTTFNQFSGWYATQSAAFRSRYQLVPQPVPYARAFLLSSSGLPVGQFRTMTLGGIPFFEASVILRALTIPTCDPGTVFAFPPAPAPLGSYILLFMVRSLKSFYKAGNAIKKLTDPYGNVFYSLARRAQNNEGRYGWTLEDYVVEQDETTPCLFSSLVPENEDLTQPIVCKQLQVIDELGNTFLFVHSKRGRKGKDRIQMVKGYTVAGPAAASRPSCALVTITNALGVHRDKEKRLNLALF